MSTFPAHTFEFCSDRDSFGIYAISDASRGIFTFIELFITIQDAFAM